MLKTTFKKTLLFAAAVLIAGPIAHVRAGEVKPTGGRMDMYNIREELSQTGYVKLLPGETYYLSSYINLQSNDTIDATGATVIVTGGATRNSEYTTGYDSMKNVKIMGGTWLSNKKDGNTGTTFSFAHCSGITLEDMDIRTTNAEGHAVELVGCKDVTIRHCNIEAQGKGKSKSVEEMIQIDLAAPTTAPFLSSKYQNGLACQNITVEGCTVTGNRAVCANYAKKNKKYLKKYHKNITVKNNKLTGNTSEALALFNTINAKVQNNTIITKSKRTSEAYSVGCHVALFGKIKAFSKGKITVTGNTIKGGRQGFFLCSHTKTKYGKLIIKNNKIYCKKGKKKALQTYSVKKVKKSGNKLYKWK